MNNQEAIGVLQSIKHKENILHEKSKKLYNTPQKNIGVEAIDMAIAALEASEKEPCEYCKDTELPSEGGVHDFRIVGNALYYYDSQFGWEGEIINCCPHCGRKLEG